jgi:hypothetical protein
MTVRLLRPFNGMPINAIVTLGAATENALVSSFDATFDLAGGVPFRPNGPYDSAPVSSVNVSLGGDAQINRGNIQKALNNAGEVVLRGAGTYLIDQPLTMYSNTRLVLADGVALKNDNRLNGRYRPMIVGSQYGKPGNSIFLLTSSATTATALCRVAHGLSVGAWVAIAGANETSYLGVFQITSVPTEFSFTYEMPAAASASPATGTALWWPADINQRIEGGEIVYNNDQLAGSDSNDRHAIIIPHHYNLSIQGVTFKDVSKYAMFLVNGRDMTVRDIRFDTDSDGLHVCGVNGAYIENMAGRCGDDFLAFLSSEGTILPYNLGTWMKFPHRAIQVKHLNGDRCAQSAVKITGGDHPYFDISIDGIYGTFGNALATVFEDAAFGLLAPDIESLELRNLYASWNTGLGAVRFNVSADSATIMKLRVERVRADLVGTQRLVNVTTTGAGVYTVDHMIVNDTEINGGGLSGAGGTVVIGASCVVNDLEFSGFRTVGTGSTNFTSIFADGTIARAYVHDGSTLNGQGFFIRFNATAGAYDVYVDNVRTFNTNNPLFLRRAGNVHATNWTHSGSTVCDLSSAGTYQFRGTGFTSTSTHFSIAGGASVEVYGFGYRGDPIALGLAATLGQFMTSTQAATEGGPCILGGAGWVALGTGGAGANTVIT